MKLRPIPNSTQPRIFDNSEYVHPWYEHTTNTPITDHENKFSEKNATVRNIGNRILIKPNPPSKEAVERAQFKDKTYHWQRDDSVRPRDKRSSK